MKKRILENYKMMIQSGLQFIIKYCEHWKFGNLEIWKVVIQTKKRNLVV